MQWCPGVYQVTIEMVLTIAMMPRSIYLVIENADYWDGDLHVDYWEKYCDYAQEYINWHHQDIFLKLHMMKWSHTCHWVYEIHWPLTFQQHNQKLNLNFWCELIELKPGGLSGRTTSRLGLSRRRRWGHQLSSISDSAKFCAFRMYVINIGITVC